MSDDANKPPTADGDGDPNPSTFVLDDGDPEDPSTLGLGDGYSGWNLTGGDGDGSNIASVDPPNLYSGHADQYGRIGSGSGGSRGNRDLRIFRNGYDHWHESGGGSSSSGSGDPHSFPNGYANLHGSCGAGGGSGSTELPDLRYGHPYWYGSGCAGSSRAVDRRSTPPGNGYYSWYNDGDGGAAMPSPSFNSMYAPQQAPTNYPYASGAVPPLVPNGMRPLPPLQPGLQEYDGVDDLISDRLSALAIDNSHHGRRLMMAGQVGNERRIAREPAAGDRSVHGDQHRSTRRDSRGHHRGRSQFLSRMVMERGVPGDVVRLMGHPTLAALADDMARLWTHEQVTRVLEILDASFPSEVMAAAKNPSGSNVLQKLIARIQGHPEQIVTFTRCLASVGELNVLTLIKDQIGTHVIKKCLETFSPEHNLFIAGVVMAHHHDVSYDRQGCKLLQLCIHRANDVETWAFLVRAVCDDGLGLAKDSCGNYVVQHVIHAVKRAGAHWAQESLHAVLRGQYVNLARQQASSHVVQRCIETFPQVYTDEIVREMLADPEYHELIHDRYANYVLQSAAEKIRGPMLQMLVEAVRPYRDILWHDMHAKPLLQMLFSTKRSGGPFSDWYST